MPAMDYMTVARTSAKFLLAVMKVPVLVTTVHMRHNSRNPFPRKVHHPKKQGKVKLPNPSKPPLEKLDQPEKCLLPTDDNKRLLQKYLVQPHETRDRLVSSTLIDFYLHVLSCSNWFHLLQATASGQSAKRTTEVAPAAQVAEVPTTPPLECANGEQCRYKTIEPTCPCRKCGKLICCLFCIPIQFRGGCDSTNMICTSCGEAESNVDQDNNTREPPPDDDESSPEGVAAKDDNPSTK